MAVKAIVRDLRQLLLRGFFLSIILYVAFMAGRLFDAAAAAGL